MGKEEKGTEQICDRADSAWKMTCTIIHTCSSHSRQQRRKTRREEEGIDCHTFFQVPFTLTSISELTRHGSLP